MLTVYYKIITQFQEVAMREPLILDIKGNSLDDGPGIRSAVFFKGCPLSCVWCHNPESKRIEAELSFDASACIGCGNCRKVCELNALSLNNPYYVDRNRCTLCYKCVDICPAKALTKVGKAMSQDELVKKLISDKPFYDVSNGGVTLTGGEATLCAEWVGELAHKLCDNGINVLLETCGQFDYDKVAQHILPYIKNIYCDIKIFNRENHKKYCGVYNDRILENIRKMWNDRNKYGYDFLPRTPLIPGITDTKENLTEIANFLSELGISKIQLLPYNPTWYSKNDKLGIALCDELKNVTGFQPKDEINVMKKIFTDKNINC
jgi:pyruvate formate lyase activating enzyme